VLSNELKKIFEQEFLLCDVIVHHLLSPIPHTWKYVSRKYSAIAFPMIYASCKHESISDLLSMVDPQYIVAWLPSLLQVPDFDLTSALRTTSLFSWILPHLSLVKLVVESPKFDPTIKLVIEDRTYGSVLDCAIVKHKNEVAKYLLTKPHINPEDNHNGAIRFSVKAKNEEMFWALFRDPRVDPSIPGAPTISECSIAAEDLTYYSLERNQTLLFAAYWGNTCIIQALIDDQRVSQSLQGHSRAFVAAAMRGHASAVEMLCNHCTKFSIYWAMNKACCAGHYEVVRILVQKIPIISPAEFDLIIRAAGESGYTNIVQLLLSRNTDPSMELSETTLHAICTANQVEVVKLLMADKRIVKRSYLMKHRASMELEEQNELRKQ
jgi:hypothetical protein